MWNFLLAFFFGSAVANTRTGRSILRPFLLLFLIGVLVAAFIYAFVVFKAVSVRSNRPHVHAHSTH
jgi:hypothetical protein